MPLCMLSWSTCNDKMGNHYVKEADPWYPIRYFLSKQYGSYLVIMLDYANRPVPVASVFSLRWSAAKIQLHMIRNNTNPSHFKCYWTNLGFQYARGAPLWQRLCKQTRRPVCPVFYLRRVICAHVDCGYLWPQTDLSTCIERGSLNLYCNNSRGVLS